MTTVSEYKLNLQDQLLDKVKAAISKPSFDTWFNEFSIVDIEPNQTIVFGTQTGFQCEWLKTRYKDLVSTCLKNITGVDYIQSFIVRTGEADIIKRNIFPSSSSKDSLESRLLNVETQLLAIQNKQFEQDKLIELLSKKNEKAER